MPERRCNPITDVVARVAVCLALAGFAFPALSLAATTFALPSKPFLAAGEEQGVDSTGIDHVPFGAEDEENTGRPREVSEKELGVIKGTSNQFLKENKNKIVHRPTSSRIDAKTNGRIPSPSGKIDARIDAGGSRIPEGKTRAEKTDTNHPIQEMPNANAGISPDAPLDAPFEEGLATSTSAASSKPGKASLGTPLGYFMGTAPRTKKQAFPKALPGQTSPFTGIGY